MQRNTHKLAAKFCLVMLGALLFLSGCGSYSSPGSQPNATPTKGGYSIIYLFDKDIQLLPLWLQKLH